MSITATVGDGYYITHMRQGIRMSRRCLSMEHAEECLRSMKEDVVVDLPRVRYYFHRDKIMILKKPNITDARWKTPYEEPDF